MIAAEPNAAISMSADCTGTTQVSPCTAFSIRLTSPVYHGDTLYAFSEVLGKEDSQQPDAGIVHFRHYGINQDDKLCVQADRRVLLKRKSHWANR